MFHNGSREGGRVWTEQSEGRPGTSSPCVRRDFTPVRLVHESLIAALSRNRRMRTATDSWQTDHRDSVRGIRIDSRDSLAVLFLPTNHANERESKSAQRYAALRSGRSSEFPIPHSELHSLPAA